VKAAQISEAELVAFGAAPREMKSPSLAFCRTGTRAVLLGPRCEAPGTSLSAIIAASANAGYDLETLRPRLIAASASNA